jgi:hypothetical protein
MQLLVFSIAVRFILSTSNPHPTSSHLATCQAIPTASVQFNHLNTVPIPYFLLANCSTLLTSRNPVITVFLLFLSGDIQPNPGPVNHSVTMYTLNIQSLFHEDRSSHIHDIIQTNNPDVFAFSETRHRPETTTPAQLSEATPPGFQLFSVPRSSPKTKLPKTSKNSSSPPPVLGGGVAFLCKDSLSPEIFILPTFQSFEAVSISLTNLPQHLTIFNIYRPPDSSNYAQPFSLFLKEFVSLLNLIAKIPHCSFLITGDFNIHCNKPSDSEASQFLSILSDFNLVQHVNFPTHKARGDEEDGNTLDLLITSTQPGCSITPTVTCLPATPSDHFALLTTLNIPLPSPQPPTTRSFRRINSINIEDFKSDLSNSKLIISPPSELNDLVVCFNTTLTSILDKHAPIITKVTQRSKSNPWFTPALKALKKVRRKFEKQWKSLPSLANLATLRKASNSYRAAIVKAKKLYHSNLIASNSTNPRQLWNTVNSLLHRSTTRSLPSATSIASLADKFTSFFSDKVTKLRASIPSVNQSPHFPQPTSAPPVLSHFRPADISEITKLIAQSPNKQCELDPVPTSILKQCVSLLAPAITTIVNLSLSSGSVPSAFKQSIVSPLLKKPNLEKENLSNYRPISNLPYLSKLTERVVKNRLSEHLGKNSLFNIFQSAYTMFHSTETVLLSLHDSIIRAICKQQVTCLCLLDLSAAFDTIDHAILLHRLTAWFGINSTALSWFESYLSQRSFVTSCGDSKSTSCLITCGVPQGSVLGPLLFSLYTTPLSSLLSATSTSHHLYADDTQLFISFLPSNFPSSIEHLQSSISQVSAWMSANLLSLNPSKTEFLIFGNQIQLSKLNNPSLAIDQTTVIKPIHTARNLGILFDSNLTFNDQISAVCKSCNWHIHDLWRIRSTLDLATAKTIATSLVHSKLDYCNSLYLNLPEGQISRLQRIQNSLARAVCKVPKHQHITPHLRSLHWLKIPERINYKLCSITYTVLQQQQPSYLHHLINNQPARPTRSSTHVTLRRPPAVRSAISNRSYYHSIPKLWESLPPELRVRSSPLAQYPSLAISRNNFLSRLKTHLFTQSYPPVPP